MQQPSSEIRAPREGSGQSAQATPYQVFMLVLCCLVLFMVAIELAVPLSRDEHAILLRVDLVICIFFLLDFFVSLKAAPDRWKYLYTWGWLDLVSSIPTLGVLQWGRAARMARVLRLIRGVRSLREVLRFLAGARRAESAVLLSILVAIVVLSGASIGVLHLERGGEGTIQTASDAIWWAIVTVTSVGYGDEVPVTHGGRILAMMLMVVGIGLFGVYTAFLASWLLAPGEDEQERELEAIRHELQALRRDLRLTPSSAIQESGRDPKPVSLESAPRLPQLVETL